MFATILQDARYTLRQWRRAPGFALTAIVVLALGLGANIAVFTLISGLFLRPLPYANPDRVMTVSLPNDDPRFFSQSMPYADLLQLRDALGPHATAAGDFGSGDVSIVGPGGRMQVTQDKVDAGFLSVLGVQPVLGRAFTPQESDPGRTRVVLLGHAVWEKLFQSDPGVVGKTLTIHSEAYSVAGVMPAGFSFPFDEGAQIWTPFEISAAAHTSMNSDTFVYSAYLRVPDGMTRDQLSAVLNAAQARIATQVTNPANFARKVKVEGYQQSLNDRARKPLLLLYAVVAGIWALACLNVMSLMLARAIARTREQAVRSALGASRGRLVVQSVVESLMLSLAGAFVGLLLAQAATHLLWKQIKHALPMTAAVQLDWRVAAGLALLTLLTALLTGIVPALRASVRDPRQGLSGVTVTASTGQNRIREGLVIGQLALTLVFLVGAGLFLRTVQALRAVPLGFAEQNVLTGGVIFNFDQRELMPRNHDPRTAPNVIRNSYLPLLDRLRAIPGVQVAALSSVLPMRTEFAVTMDVELDHHEPKGQRGPISDGRIASAGMVEALGIPMLRGRFFAESDTASAPPVAVVNKAFADKYLAGKDPLGHTLSIGDGRFADVRIVGEIDNVKQNDVKKATSPEIYFCLAQLQPGVPMYDIAAMFMEVAIRANVPADTLRAQFDRALHEVAPDATTTDVMTIHEAVERSFGSAALTAHLLEAFAALALMIASVGLYGLLSFTVAQRSREIGIRIALGAPRDNILGLVFRRAMLLAVLGLAIGGVLAWFAVRLAHGYLYGVEPHDAVTFALVLAVLAAAASAAAWLPARRAAAVDPMLALRSE